MFHSQTGGGTGIGLMITQALATNGAKVYITGRREEALKKVAELYNSGPGIIVALPGDISQKDDLKRLASVLATKERNGIHLLVNNGMCVLLSIEVTAPGTLHRNLYDHSPFKVPIRFLFFI